MLYLCKMANQSSTHPVCLLSNQISIDTTPFIADLGYQAAIPAVQSILQSLDYNEIVEDLGIKFKVVRQKQYQMAHAQRSEEQHANESRDAVGHQMEDLALVHCNVYTKSATYKKMQLAFLSSFRVIRKFGDNLCDVDLPDHRKTYCRMNA